MKNKTFTPPQIIISKEGNSYYSTASNVIGKQFASEKLKEIAEVLEYKNTFFVAELADSELIIRAAQSSFENAMKYFNLVSDNKNRMIIHKHKFFQHIKH